MHLKMLSLIASLILNATLAQADCQKALNVCVDYTKALEAQLVTQQQIDKEKDKQIDALKGASSPSILPPLLIGTGIGAAIASILLRR